LAHCAPTFVSADRASFRHAQGQLSVCVGPQLLEVQGVVHSFVLKGLSFEIVPSEIRTPDGEIVETVG
jgi:hypothetical protein